MEDLVEELEMYEADEEDEDDEAPTLEDLFRDNYDLNIRFE